jgi:hypothetical protein
VRLYYRLYTCPCLILLAMLIAGEQKGWLVGRAYVVDPRSKQLFCLWESNIEVGSFVLRSILCVVSGPRM